MAVAEASFNTLNDSMSWGLIIDSLFDSPFTPSLSIAIPSITIRGSLLALSDEPPRMRICAPPPGVPSLDMTLTPATLPWIMSWALPTRPLFFESGFKAVTDPVKSLFFTVP